MRPVNLLPPRHRPRSGGGSDSRASYVTLGVLGALVLAVLLYVVSANQVSSRNAEIAATQQRTQAAESQAVTLQSFGDFAGKKQARLAAVTSLANARLDWERLFRELARVLPKRAWLMSFEGSASGAQNGAEETGTGATPAGAGPVVKLKGCAESHSDVADVMVRLRELHGAADVALTESRRAVDEAGDGDVAAAGVTSCGRHTSFSVDVTLAPNEPEAGGGKVPAGLGGGA